MASRETVRVENYLKMNKLALAAGAAARTLEQLRVLRGHIPGEGFSDVIADIDEVICMTQTISYFVADAVCMASKHFVNDVVEPRIAPAKGGE